MQAVLAGQFMMQGILLLFEQSILPFLLVSHKPLIRDFVKAQTETKYMRRYAPLSPIFFLQDREEWCRDEARPALCD